MIAPGEGFGWPHPWPRGIAISAASVAERRAAFESSSQFGNHDLQRAGIDSLSTLGES
jgi:hypothetical protein